jgi:hypothetical protein
MLDECVLALLDTYGGDRGRANPRSYLRTRTTVCDENELESPLTHSKSFFLDDVTD